MLLKKINYYFENTFTDPSGLAVFRILFGLLMLFSLIRFWYKGWIESLYINPTLNFKYYGFEWVESLGSYTYLLFIICAIASLFVALGFKYKFSIIIFFLSFTYIELIDKTTYLNHYYFVSVLSFLMCFLPANKFFSLDNYLDGTSCEKIPKWTVDSIKLLICIVYFYAGLAKINSDWLLKAMPLAIWLPSKYDIPLIGQTFMQLQWVHYLMSWGGMIYDLAIPFLLLNKKTRPFAFILVIIFHLLTKILFPIGMFPYIMIFSALIFFDSGLQKKILKKISSFLRLFKKNPKKHINIKSVSFIRLHLSPISKIVLICFFLFQLLFPFRYVFYPGELFWNEEGYRFSWRVMLVEKKGATDFKITDSISKKYFYVNNRDFLTAFQEKQMSFQPDFILEYAHFLGNHFKGQGHQNIQVFADSYVGLNGRLSQRFIDPKVNLFIKKESFKHKKWVIPLNDEIKGF